MFHSNDDLFTQYLFLKVSFDDFFMTAWERENESERKKEPQIPRLWVPLTNCITHQTIVFCNLRILVNRTKYIYLTWIQNWMFSFEKRRSNTRFIDNHGKLNFPPKEGFPLFVLPLFSDLIAPIASERLMIGYFSTQFSSDFSRVWS